MGVRVLRVCSREGAAAVAVSGASGELQGVAGGWHGEFTRGTHKTARRQP